MIIRFERTLTVAQFLDELRERYGGEKGLRRHITRNPRDALARWDLEELEYYVARPQLLNEKMRTALSLIPANEAALSVLSPKRLKLLDALLGNRFTSIRQLARHLKRDVHNVYDDLRKFESMGVLEFDRGPRNSRIPKLMADSISIVPDVPTAHVQEGRRRERSPRRR